MYALRPITFLRRRVHVVMQNENGPCPLLSLCNVLLLRNQLELPADCVALECITAEALIHRFAEKLLDANPQLAADPNAGKVIEDAVACLPRLNRGLDVNLFFCADAGVTAFEYTAEFALFDLLDVTLAHGWLVDPEDRRTVRAQLVFAVDARPMFAARPCLACSAVPDPPQPWHAPARSSPSCLVGRCIRACRRR